MGFAMVPVIVVNFL